MIADGAGGTPELWAPRGLQSLPADGELLVTDTGKHVVWQLSVRHSRSQSLFKSMALWTFCLIASKPQSRHDTHRLGLTVLRLSHGFGRSVCHGAL